MARQSKSLTAIQQEAVTRLGAIRPAGRRASGSRVAQQRKAILKRYARQARALGYSDTQIAQQWQDIKDVAQLEARADNPAQLAKVRRRGGKVDVVATHSGETDAQLLNRTNAIKVLSRTNTNPTLLEMGEANEGDSWADLTDEDIERAESEGWLGQRAMSRAARRQAAQPRFFNVTWYSSLLHKRTGFMRPIEAHNATDAKRQAKAMVTNDPKATNFIAKEVKRNPRGGKVFIVAGYDRTGKYHALTITATSKARALAMARAQNKEVSDPKLRVTKWTAAEQKRNGVIEAAAGLQALEYIGGKVKAGGKPKYNPKGARGLTKRDYDQLVKEYGEAAAKKALAYWNSQPPGFRQSVKPVPFLRANEYLWRAATNPPRRNEKPYAVPVKTLGNNGRWQSATKPVMAISADEARAFVREDFLIAGGGGSATAGETAGGIKWRIGKPYVVSALVWNRLKRRWNPRGSRDAFGVFHPVPKENPSVSDVSQMFQGKKSGDVAEFAASASAPRDLARIGELVFLKLENVGSQTRVPGAMVAADTKGRLWIVGDQAPMFERKAKPGAALDYGPIAKICYRTAKAHIGEGKQFEYVHEFGEEGGARPHLLIDHEGMPILQGGDYTIKSEGIVN